MCIRDRASEVLPVAMIYAGKEPYSRNAKDYDAARDVLKAEMRRLGSLVIDCADCHALPAGGALAVDRNAFSREVTHRVQAVSYTHLDVYKRQNCNGAHPNGVSVAKGLSLIHI